MSKVKSKSKNSPESTSGARGETQSAPGAAGTLDKKEFPTDAIAIVGMACMYPKSPDLKGFWHLIRAGIDGISDVPSTHWNPEDYFSADPKAPDMTYCRRGGFLTPHNFDPTEFSLPPTVLEATDTSQLLGLVVAKAALEDAGYGADREFKRDRTSVVLGVTGTLELVVPLGARLGHPVWRKAMLESGLAPGIVDEVMARMSDGFVGWQENSFPGLLGNVVAGRIANRLDLHGTNCVVDAACASSLSAAHLAVMELATGKSDIVVTGGVDTFNDIFMFMCFSKTPALSASGQIRPFSEASDGTMLGEGLGMVVLKRLADAQADGDRIYALIRGVGTSSDGNSGAVYAPSSEGQARCLRDAYKTAGVDPSQIRLVEAHGTGTKVGDVVEFEGLRSVYSEVGPEKGWCALGSVKSQIGHTKSAAGSASLIKAALALHFKVFPPTIGVEKPNPKMRVEESPFYLNTEARPWVSEPGMPRRAALSSFGFGGSNFHMVLEEADPIRHETAWDGSIRLFAASAGSPDQLASKLREISEGLSLDPNEQARAASESTRSFQSGDAARAVLVWNTDRDPRAMLDQAAEKVSQGQSVEGPDLFFQTGQEAGKVVFMFPGQGSQYVGMGREVACVFPEFLQSLELVDESAPSEDRLTPKIYPAPTFSEDVRKANEELLTQTNNAQPALGAMNRGLLEILRRFGVAPDFACGHSYGELCALYAAGVYDAESLNRVSFLRGQLMAVGDGGRGGMAAVTAPIEKVEALLSELKLDVVVANRNSPSQCVLSGTKEAVKEASAKLKEAGLRAIPLQVGAAFHSPLVATAEKPFRQGLESISFKTGSFPVVANKTAQNYPQGNEAKDILASQLVSQVNWVGQVELLHEQGARTFVEVGPKNVLSKLVGAILKGKAHKTVALDSSAGKNGLLDLARGLANLAALGLSVDIAGWETAPLPGRLKKMSIPISGANYRAPHGKNLPPVREANSVNTVDKQPKAVAAAPVQAAAVNIPTVTARVEEKKVPQPDKYPVKAGAPQSGPLMHEAMQNIQSTLVAVQALQQQTAQTHQKFLEGQEAAQRTFQSMVENQRKMMEAMLGQGPVAAPAPVAWSAPAPQRAVAASPTPAVSRPAAPKPVVAAKAPVVSEPAPWMAVPAPVRGAIASAPVSTGTDVSAALLSLVAEKTGYPQEMLTLDMDLEGDLGIDSIKRVEILAAIQEKLPALPAIASDQMGSMRTLKEIVQALGAVPSSPAVAPVSAKADAGVSQQLLAVVADKTGYPVEMLTLEMDLESDLGIDSIKRVEILAAVEEKVPGLPKIAPDTMGALRTLGEIVSAFGVTAAPAPVPSAPVAVAKVGGTGVAEALLGVVADKTGYPREMLSLHMDLESDLGIDSIKRVEILAAIEEQVPGLPKIAPDAMGALRTLGEIVEAFGASTATTAPPVVHAHAPVVPGRAHGPAVSDSLLAVVAEKTGYPREMLTLEMDLESDLGIDSIKRVEILAAIEEQVPGLPKIAPDQMGALRTLGEIVEAFGAGAMVPALALAAVAVPTPHVSGSSNGNLLKIVSEKTGYPEEMLTLDMDLEADLGIDSIKRVEILAALEDGSRIPSDQVGSLRTLRQVLEAMGSPSTNGNGATHANLAPPPSTLERRVLAFETHPLTGAESPGKFPVATGHEVLVVSDETPLATVLVKQLQVSGVNARLGDQLPEKLGGLIFVSQGKGGEDFLRRAFQLTRQAAPALRKAATMGGALLASIAQMDGQFGLSGKAFNGEAGGLTGLPKTAAHEWGDVVCRAFDVDPQWTDLEAAALALIQELSQGGALETGLSSHGRVLLDTPLMPIKAGPALLAEGDVVLVTGGARGVTAATAIALAQAMRPTLVLLGRSAPPSPEPTWLSPLNVEGDMKRAIMQNHFNGHRPTPKDVENAYKTFVAEREVSNTLRAIEGAGAKVVYRSLDVRDAGAVKRVVDGVRKELGQIRGLIHAAGVLADKKIEEKTDEMFDSVFATKILGLKNLLKALEGDDLKALVLFSSVTARFGRPGQVDYCMANDVLNKLAHQEQRKRPKCRVVSLNWGPWAGGMVNEGLAKEFHRLGIGLIDLQAGAQALVNELSQPVGGAVEVLYGDGFPAPPSVAAPARQRDGALFETSVSLEDYPCLDSHVIGQRPVVPVALMLEWFAHAALHGIIGPRFVGLQSLQIFKPLAVMGGQPVPIEIIENGEFLELRGVSTGTVHARARVQLGDDHPPAPAALNREPFASRFYPHKIGDVYTRLLFHGPHFQGIERIHGFSENGMVAEVSSAPRVSQWITRPVRTDWLADPMVIDCALQMGILWGLEILGKHSLPLVMGSYQQFQKRFPKNGLTAILAVTSHTASKIVAEVDFVDEEGRLVARCEGIEWTADVALAKAFNRPLISARG